MIVLLIFEGGLSRVAMGGDFEEGFAYGAEAAGLSYVAGEIAGAMRKVGVEGTGTEDKTTQLNPINELPEASSLPSDARSAIVIEGGEIGFNNDIHAGAEEARNELVDKGYSVGAIVRLTSQKQADAYFRYSNLTGKTVILRVHHYIVEKGQSGEGAFSWSGGVKGAITSDSQMVALLSKARTAIFLSCNTAIPAQNFAVNGKHAWGLSGYMTTTFTYNEFWGYRAAFWSRSTGKWY